VASAMDRWVLAVSEELGLTPNLGDTRLILDLTKEVAHNVDRPAAPVAAYLVGIAVGQGKPPTQAVKCIQDLAAGWEGNSEES
jgi:hypothetical protein